MIIQPGIAKANLGVSREDVTLEDHVSYVPVNFRKIRAKLYSSVILIRQSVGAYGMHCLPFTSGGD